MCVWIYKYIFFIEIFIFIIEYFNIFFLFFFCIENREFDFQKIISKSILVLIFFYNWWIFTNRHLHNELRSLLGGNIYVSSL